MKILITASEAVPYIKTGGLADVTGTLAVELAKARHEVILALPLYQQIDKEKWGLELAVDFLGVKMGDSELYGRVWKKKVLSKLTVIFIEYDRYFDRNPIYNDGAKDYYDNGSRFAFLSKAALDACVSMDFQPDVVHANDWQTALMPYYVKTWNFPNGFFDNTACLLSIHNIGYQGHMPSDIMSFIGVQKWQFRDCEFESFGGLNFLKGGIFYADKVTTVSPSYADEILGEPGGSGLSPYLERRKDDVVGILNGIDLKEWNPKKDKLIPANFDAEDLSGKAICKADLQKEFGLPVDEKIPLFGLVGRLADQKGLDLLKGCIEELLTWDIQIVLLGSGDPELAAYFGSLPARFPTKFGSYIGFDPRLAHLIEAGSDFFIMPSRYEPCGLNQMYSLTYGTLPIVRATGGLKDTVENYEAGTGLGTGFVFETISVDALKNTIGWAVDTWFNHPKDIASMQQKALAQDFSWKQAIKQYVVAYKAAQKRRKLWV